MTQNGEILDYLQRIEKKVDANAQITQTVANDQSEIRKDVADLKRRMTEVERDAVMRTDLADLNRKHADEMQLAGEHHEKVRTETLAAVEKAQRATLDAVEGVKAAAIVEVEAMKTSTLEAVALETAKQSLVQNPMLERLSKWHAHPLIKVVGAIIASAIASYLAAKGH